MLGRRWQTTFFLSALCIVVVSTTGVALSSTSCSDVAAIDWVVNPGLDGLNTHVCSVSELYPGACFNTGTQLQVNITSSNINIHMMVTLIQRFVRVYTVVFTLLTYT